MSSRGVSVVASWRERLKGWWQNDALRRGALLVAILLVLAYFKVPFTQHEFETHADGGYYTDIAAHVRDGQGLTTNLCLMYKGCPQLPHPADIYPLWPLLLGLVAKLFPLLAAAKWLPFSLYFTALVLGYLWASRLAPEPLFPSTVPYFDAGHLFVILLGLTKDFFYYTSSPYTEGLTFAIVLATLWRSHSLWHRPSWRTGLELGVWLGLGFLARTQQLLLALAAATAFAAALAFQREKRRAYSIMASAALGTFILVVLPHYLHLRSFVPDFTPLTILRWDQTRFSNALPAIHALREVQGLGPYLADRWEGVEVAFALSGGKLSYRDQFHTFTFALLVAIPLLAVRALQPGRLRSLWEALRRPEHLATIFAVVYAIGALVSLQGMHLNPSAGEEWLFGGRWGAPSGFVFFLALLLLVRQRVGPWRAAGVLLLCSGIWFGLGALQDVTREMVTHKQPKPSAIVRWLNEQTAAGGRLTVAARRPQMIAYQTPLVGYHWFPNQVKLSDVEAMVTELGVDYLLTSPDGGPLARNRARFDSAFELVATVGRNGVFAPTEALLARSKRRDKPRRLPVGGTAPVPGGDEVEP